MAAADYALCAHCTRKALYDADVDYSSPSFGAQLVLCTDCTTAGFRLQVVAPEVTC